MSWGLATPESKAGTVRRHLTGSEPAVIGERDTNTARRKRGQGRGRGEAGGRGWS